MQGAEQAGNVSIRWQDAPAFTGVAFGTASDYVTVPAGEGSLDIVPTSSAAASVPVQLAPGAVYSVIVVQHNGTLSADLRTDAAGAEAAPSGGIATGLGGTAPSGGPGIADGADPGREPVRPLALVLLLAAAGCGSPAPAAPPAPTSLPAVATSPAPVTPAAEAAPVRVRIPDIGVDSPIVDIGVDGTGALVPPEGTEVTGWYFAGPAPGATGPALLAGHVDSRSGPAVFYRLHEIPVGARVDVTRSDGAVAAFVVTRSYRTPKATFRLRLRLRPDPRPRAAARHLRGHVRPVDRPLPRQRGRRGRGR